MIRRACRACGLVALAVVAACATVGTAPIGSGAPAAEARTAVTELLHEDFATARTRLLELASRCESGPDGRRAVLLLAAAELDTGNDGGSPRIAAHLARSYLQLPHAPSEELVLARSLYRMAANLGGLETQEGADPLPTVAHRFEACSSDREVVLGPLPSVPEETIAARIRRLQAQVSARSDSLEAARTRSAASAARVDELEAELRRITELLRSGAERQSSMDRQ